MKYKPLYVAANKHNFLKSYAKKKGTKLNQITNQVIEAGIKVLKLAR